MKELTPQKPADQGVPVSHSIAAVIGLAVSALMIRALIYFRIEDVLHADEALQGLIARHILGGEVQLFTYGLPYLGTLQAHWIAACFAALGQSTVVLKWAAGLESLLLVGANYLLAREASGGSRRAGLFAALLTAVGPLYLIEWSLRPRGGHLEVATLSALALWAALKAIRTSWRLATSDSRSSSDPGSPEQSKIQNRKSKILWLALCGFLLGLGWWVHLTMFFAIATCVLAVALWAKGVGTRVTAVAAGLPCFLLGSAPFWLFNVKYSWRTLRAIGEGLGGAMHFENLASRVDATAGISLPVLLGARQTEAAQSFGPTVVALAFGVWLAAILAAIFAARGNADPGDAAANPTRRAVVLLLIFSALAPVVFIAGPFADQARDPRVLLPLYAALPVLAGIGLARIHAAKSAFRHVAIAGLAVLLMLNLTGYRRADRTVIQPSLTELRVPANLDMLRLILDTHGITRVFTNYYIGYRLAFESGGKIIACTDGDPAPERYQPFAEEARTTDRPLGFIGGPRTMALFRGALKERGIAWKESRVQGLVVVQPAGNAYRGWPPSLGLCAPAAIEVGNYPKKCAAGSSFTVSLTVANRSAIPWLAITTNTCVVQVSYHVVEAETGRMVRYDNPRLSPAAELGRGQSATVNMAIYAPETPGRYAFIPNLVVEYLGWLSGPQPEMAARANWREFEVEK